MGDAILCISEHMHPFECDAGCRHCLRMRGMNHDPQTCDLCEYDNGHRPHQDTPLTKEQRDLAWTVIVETPLDSTQPTLSLAVDFLKTALHEIDDLKWTASKRRVKEWD